VVLPVACPRYLVIPAAPSFTVVAAPYALIVIALVLNTANGLAVVTIPTADVVNPSGSAKVLLIVVVPVFAPMLIVVAAPAKFTVVAVVFTKANDVLLVVIPVLIAGVLMVGVVANTIEPVPVAPVDATPSTDKCPLIVVVPPATPIFNILAAPNAFTVAAVVLNTLRLVALVLIVPPVNEIFPFDEIAASWVLLTSDAL